MAGNYYERLSVKSDASQAEIQKSFRKLAKQHHPDRNPGNKEAEATFKGLSEAYETLSNPEKRKEYDLMQQYGAYPGQQAGRQANGQEFDFRGFGQAGRRGTVHVDGEGDAADWDEILSSFFGGDMNHATGRTRTMRTPQRGHDLAATITVSFMESVKGTTRMVQIGPRKLKVKIPAGIEDNGKIRLAGQGEPGIHDGPGGDVIITINVAPDPHFSRHGLDIHSSVELDFREAILGTKKSVKTLDQTLSLTIPPGSQPGAKLRLKGQGLKLNGATGDHIVEITVTVPKTVTEKQKKLLEDWDK